MSDIGKNAVNSVAALARSAARSTRRLGRIAKLNLSISDEKKNIRRLYTEIGRLYYEARRDDPEGFFVHLVQEIDASMEALESMETELKSLKAESAPEDAAYEPAEAPDVEVEICQEPEGAPAGDDEEPDIEVEIHEEPEVVPADAPAPDGE